MFRYRQSTYETYGGAIRNNTFYTFVPNADGSYDLLDTRNEKIICVASNADTTLQNFVDEQHNLP